MYPSNQSCGCDNRRGRNCWELDLGNEMMKLNPSTHARIRTSMQTNTHAHTDMHKHTHADTHTRTHTRLQEASCKRRCLCDCVGVYGVSLSKCMLANTHMTL